MVKKSKIAIVLTLAVGFCFAFMALNSSSVIAGGDCSNCEQTILRNVKQVRRILIDEVVPKLDCEAGVPKTGQTTSYALGDDGELQMGIPWPVPRFTDHDDGTVTDNLTHLMWTQDAQQISGNIDWFNAVDACNNLNFADYDDWRLPNIRELQSLMDYGRAVPNALPDPHPFMNVRFNNWSSTTFNGNASSAWVVNMGKGWVDTWGKGASDSVWCWCVRGGN